MGSRLARLERLAPAPPRKRWTDFDWLIHYEKLGAEGFFVSEPDYPVAIQLFRNQLAAGDPRPHATYVCMWLHEMYERVRDGIPAVTEIEYNELDRWFSRNRSAILDGRDFDPLKGCIGKGPRHMFATKYIQRLRRLKAARPDLK
jgi:hypothetical protein